MYVGDMRWSTSAGKVVRHTGHWYSGDIQLGGIGLLEERSKNEIVKGKGVWHSLKMARVYMGVVIYSICYICKYV